MLAENSVLLLWNYQIMLANSHNIYSVVQKPLLGFGGRFFRIGIRFENISKMIVITVVLTIYGKNSIKDSDCVAKISIFTQIM